MLINYGLNYVFCKLTLGNHSHMRTMVLVYKKLQDWVILFVQMLVNMPYTEHMGYGLWQL